MRRREACAVTGISDSALLRASHIVPWSACTSDAQRLYVNNGLLLSALWDAAFDTGLVIFNDSGTAIFGPSCSPEAVRCLARAPNCAVHQRLSNANGNPTLYVWIAGAEGNQHADMSQPVCLAVSANRPGRRGAEQRDERPPSHSITSSAWA